MNSVASKIKKHLHPLIGLKLSIARLGGTMRGFHFGEVRTIEHGTAGEYTLHISCPWRIENQEGIFTGGADLFERDTVAMGLNRPGWTYEDGNLQDERLAFLLKGYDPQTHSHVNATDNLVVENVEADAYCGLILFLSGGYRLVLLPTNSTGESWRFFSYDTEGSHFVVGAGKAEKH
jgi:hypothetical protein